MKVPVYNLKFEKVKQVELPDKIFDLELNMDLLHQVVRVLQLNLRKPIAHTKDRGEVSGGGKKPWRQKGTGRARHGSIRSPIWRGGGTTHGPRTEKSYARKINKKMERKALLEILSSKVKQEKFLVLENRIKLEQPKTKLAESYLKAILKQGKKFKRALIINNFDSKQEARAFYNLNYLKLIPVKNINILDLVSFPYVLVSEKSLKDLINHLSK
jgi:large subunit ribosomal protein L4